MTIKNHFRKNIVLATPVIIGQLGHIMVSVADTVMVGKVGVIPLAGATFATAIYHVFMLFGLGVSYAITPLVAATQPADKKGRLVFLQNSILLNTLLALIMCLTALMFFWSGTVGDSGGHFLFKNYFNVIDSSDDFSDV